jgi:hypothetical protein
MTEISDNRLLEIGWLDYSRMVGNPSINIANSKGATKFMGSSRRSIRSKGEEVGRSDQTCSPCANGTEQDTLSVGAFPTGRRFAGQS